MTKWEFIKVSQSKLPPLRELLQKLEMEYFYLFLLFILIFIFYQLSYEILFNHRRQN